MVKINKSPAPIKIKNSDDYRKGVVFDTIRKDFHDKCYLCEDKPAAVNVEHIVPHKNDDKLKYDWENLFLSCVHCNNTKLALADFDNIIDCTKIDPEDVIDFIAEPFPKIKPQFIPKGMDACNEQTVKLLERVFCEPQTPVKSLEAVVLCDHLYYEIKSFINKIEEYFNAQDSDIKKQCYTYVAGMIRKSSPFAAFKRAIIRKFKEYYDAFAKELED